MRRVAAVVFFTGLMLIASLSTFAQGGQTAPASPATEVVVGSGNFSPIVSDLEKSLAFYNDLLGAMPAATPAWGADPALLNFLGVPGAQLRFSAVRIPGSTMRVEIVEFKDIDRKAAQPRLQDPGATRLILIVRDVDALLAHLKERGVRVVTTGNTPVKLDTTAFKGRAVIVKDPDGFFVELRQPDVLPESTAPATSNVMDARVGVTVEDTEKTVRFYRDVLGLQPQAAPAFVSDRAMMDVMGTSGARVRLSTTIVPTSRLVLEFVEFQGIDRKPIGVRIQDPGATRLQLRVNNTDAAVKAMTAAGGVVVTTGGNGGPIDMQGLRVAIVRDLNNLFVVTMAGGQAAPRPAR
jgi:catechol 2,3-dioxygenase-like lactoylglutathione lyase family enzyme